MRNAGAGEVDLRAIFYRSAHLIKLGYDAGLRIFFRSAKAKDCAVRKTTANRCGATDAFHFEQMKRCQCHLLPTGGSFRL